jgi:hypothetical protein
VLSAWFGAELQIGAIGSAVSEVGIEDEGATHVLGARLNFEVLRLSVATIVQVGIPRRDVLTVKQRPTGTVARPLNRPGYRAAHAAASIESIAFKRLRLAQLQGEYRLGLEEPARTVPDLSIKEHPRLPRRAFAIAPDPLWVTS